MTFSHYERLSAVDATFLHLLATRPVHETDPRRRLAAVGEETQRLKRSRPVKGAEILEEMSNQTFTRIIVDFARLAANQRAYNTVVTNVPAPPLPVYLLGARMSEIYPVVPLFKAQGVEIALFSYDGSLYWGIDADWHAMPDLHDFAEALDQEFEALHEAALRASRSDASAGAGAS